ncbi:hypothetical protein BC831DRAFT_433422 [Entophlyctis helioformis]|nr:hypothetical protein BC831DRAFT_433422 [Entophlyctis helioformis]
MARASCIGDSLAGWLAGWLEINDRIEQLDFKDCKVLISNVDSQLSHNDGIVVQVLGEMSRKGDASHKFAQTFFLAVQPNGYFVLNDIFRFLKEDIDNVYEESADLTPDADELLEVPSVVAPAPAEAHAAPAPAAAVAAAPIAQPVEPVAATPIPAAAPVAAARTASPVRVKQAFAETKPEPTPAVIVVDKTKETATPVAAPAEQAAAPAKSEPIAAATPARAASPKKSPQAQSSPKQQQKAAEQQKAAAPAPAEPQQPKTWASLAASNKKDGAAVVTASVSTPAAKPQQATQYNNSNNNNNQHSQQQQNAVRAKNVRNGSASPVRRDDITLAIASAASTATAAPAHGSDAHAEESNEFREVQGRREHHRRNNDERDKQSIYIRNIVDGVDRKVLTEVFSAVGPVRNVEIPHGKHMAFVEFSAPEFALKAIGNTFVVGGVKVVPEERRKPGSIARGPGGANRGSFHNNNNNGNGHVATGPNQGNQGNNANAAGNGQQQQQRGGSNGRGYFRGGYQGRNNNNNGNRAPAPAAAAAPPAAAGVKA